MLSMSRASLHTGEVQRLALRLNTVKSRSISGMSPRRLASQLCACVRAAPFSAFSLLIRRIRSRRPRIDLRPPCPISGFPTPEDFEASAMPSQDGLRSHHLHRTNKARPEPGHEQRAIAAAQSKTRWCPSQSDGKLMAENQILSFKPAPRLEQVGCQHSERVQDCKHRSQWCDDSVLQCESGPDGIFGRDSGFTDLR